MLELFFIARCYAVAKVYSVLYFWYRLNLVYMESDSEHSTDIET